MVVRTQDRRPGHSGAVGLHIGTLNAQQYFARDLQHIELELDHLRMAGSAGDSRSAVKLLAGIQAHQRKTGDAGGAGCNDPVRKRLLPIANDER